MKKVVERVQRENEALKKSSAPAHQDKVAALEQENRRLKVSHLTCVKVTHLFPSCSRWLTGVFILQADCETLKSQSEAELSARLESKTKGLQKVVMENERLRKEIRRVSALMSGRWGLLLVTDHRSHTLSHPRTEQEMESAGRLRAANTSLEVTNGKLEAELEETKRRLLAALSKPATEGADGKTWKASVVTRSAVCSASGLFRLNRSDRSARR